MEDERGPGVDEQARQRVRATMAADRQSAETSGPRVVFDRIPRCSPPRTQGPRDKQAAEHYAAAIAALTAGDLEAAEAALRRSLSRDDSHPSAWRELGMLLVDRGRFAEAEMPLERAVGYEGLDFEVLRFRAIARDRLGRTDEAMEDYRLFLTLAPDEHQKPRTHAAMRVEVLARDEAGEEGPGVPGASLVEELTPEQPPAVRPGLVALLVLAWAWVLVGELTEAPEPKKPEGKLTTAYVLALAAREDEAALVALSSLVVDGHSEVARPPIEAAIDALVARGGPAEVETMVTALAVAVRRSSFRAWERAHRDAVVRALEKLDRTAVAAALRVQIASREKPDSEVDRRVLRELESQRLRAEADAAAAGS